ncbi:purine-cytosine permease family protein [Nocardia pseudobrasiliensis]|uniref:NCS1 family nucleobase:cation symporter-1 n=1 Tax=Nocardia pseudobrasiliensis TaxID=45979 RepID=A0A370I2N3_9NOCA|nr:cytosine permease [Nocardia pseudobrasiliensis]RDI64966.1 NCS1 family nucleobase:cation symporter-1 [Nocardia pseudobrasiliensis]
MTAYGDRVLAVEPGGSERIPDDARHGAPRSLFWIWMSPNLEFATIFVGVLAVTAFGLSFGQAVLGVALGTALGAVSHGVLSARGPRYGVPQMVLGRTGFGYRGNALPAGFMAVMCGVGWFATNSVSGAFALASLTGSAKLPALAIVVVAQTAFAFFGHNLVQAFERLVFPVLAVVFAIVTVVIFAHSHVDAPATGAGGIGGFLLTVGAAFGYAAGWNPYAADYSRYLPTSISRVATGGWAAAGLFVSCVWLEVVGAASTTIAGSATGSPTDIFTANLPAALAKLTLLAIVLGAIAANALNVYSGAMAFVTMGIRLPTATQRALVSAVFGVIGFLVAWWALADAAAGYEAFLLIVAYWIGPWLGVMFADQWLRRGRRIDDLLYDRAHRNLVGVAAFVAGLVGSVLLFSNQARFVGYAVRAIPGLGDITFFAGFVVAAAAYLIFAPASTRTRVMAA